MKFEGDMRNRDAAGAPLEPRPTCVDELPPGEVAGEPALLQRTETVTEEQAFRSTDFTCEHGG